MIHIFYDVWHNWLSDCLAAFDLLENAKLQSVHKQTSADTQRLHLSPLLNKHRLTLSNWPKQLKGGSAVYLHTAQRLRGQMLSVTYGAATHYEGDTDTWHGWRPTHMQMHKHTTKYCKYWYLILHLCMQKLQWLNSILTLFRILNYTW